MKEPKKTVMTTQEALYTSEVDTSVDTSQEDISRREAELLTQGYTAEKAAYLSQREPELRAQGYTRSQSELFAALEAGLIKGAPDVDVPLDDISVDPL